MTHQTKLARCTGVRRPVTPHSVFLVVLILSAFFLSGVPVGAGESDLDLSFNGGGVVVTDYDEFDQIHDIVIQPDGKIVAAGRSGFIDGPEQRFDMMVARYNSDGSLDDTFGFGGIVTTTVLFDATAMGVALQEDGKIVVAGTGSVSLSPRFALVRYNTDGSLDDTFGWGGIVRQRIGRSSQSMDLAIQPDGKIVAAGEATMSRSAGPVATLARFETDGVLDFTFGNGGVSQAAALTASPMLSSNGIALHADGKIAVAGVCQVASLQQFCLSRFNVDGSLDSTFNGGQVATDFYSFASSGVAEDLSIQPDGKIVAVGQAISGAGSFTVLARFNDDGSFDYSFGLNSDGITIEAATPFRAESIALKPDGKIVIAGEYVFSPFHSEMAVARYTSEGFIEDLTAIGIGEHAAATAVAIQADGKIVAGGYGNLSSEFANLSDFALVRYGTDDPT